MEEKFAKSRTERMDKLGFFKKNGMGKLIELLNEFLKKEDKSIYTFYWNQVFNCIHRGNGERCDKEWICSKSFGFIKWLVDNDKINEIKLRGKMYQVFEFRYQDVATLENELLMLLSISDTPIEDLILYLK